MPLLLDATAQLLWRGSWLVCIAMFAGWRCYMYLICKQHRRHQIPVSIISLPLSSIFWPCSGIEVLQGQAVYRLACFIEHAGPPALERVEKTVPTSP